MVRWEAEVGPQSTHWWVCTEDSSSLASVTDLILNMET